VIERLLIANRGEIARRIVRTCRRLGIATVAVYSDADRSAAHVRDADEAVRIGPAAPTASYLDVDAVVRAALDTGCDAVHPGYGFLAENAAFARAVTGAGLTFVGPTPEVIELMGDKAAAKRHLAAAGVPVVPGEDRDDLDDQALLAAAADVGFPLLVKAVAGGGGKGMRTVEHPDHLPDALASARREAAAAFGDDRVILERRITRPRHVEIQVMADHHGSVVHLLERECSIQRRHQKVVEEAPSPALTPALRAAMGDAAVTAAAAVGYRGAGTVEFLVDGTTLDADDPTFAFLEMNTRLQVEHPVTELVTGLDLVELQLRVAAGAPLPLTQDDVRADGHAIEVRLYAEDPTSHLPQTGTIVGLEVPTGDGIRLDSGVEVGDVVSSHYDPMLAKLIVHATDRDRACDRLREVLAATSVRGVITNLPLLAAIAEVPAFRTGELSTSFLDDHLAGWQPPAPSGPALAAAALAVVQDAVRTDGAGPAAPAASVFVRIGPLRVGGGGTPVLLRAPDGTTHDLEVRREGDTEVVRRDGAPLDTPAADAVRTSVTASRDGRTTVWVHADGTTHHLEVLAATHWADAAAPTGHASFTAPMPGSVLGLPVAAGDHVAAGATLVVVEAMKMEHPVTAPTAGTVSVVHVAVGDAVDAGAVLVEFDPDDVAEVG
jgi:acetyl-CoA carboxylase biotin carboxylase subunit